MMHVIATAGHVDHGKSTLIRLLTGMEPDRWAEERRRGLTIDLGFAWTTLDRARTVAFVDVPGHERFVANMLAGVGPVPAVLFVVAADEGWMPQSTEHRDALNALGVRHGILVVTRADLADPGPVLAQAQAELRGTTLADLSTVEVSGTTGAGLDRLRAALEALAHRLPEPDRTADVRLWVDRAFTVRGAGTVVTATLSAGTLRTGQELVLLPSGRRVTVRGLQSLGEEHTQVEATARVAVNLRGVPVDAVRRGDALVVPQRWLSTNVVDVRLRGVPDARLPPQLMLHIGSAAVAARVRPLGADTARLSLRTPLPLRVGDRGVLRDPGSHRIPAGAVVLDVRPPALTRRGAARRRADELTAMHGPDGAGELRRRRVVRAGELQAMGHPPPPAPQAGEWLMEPSYRDTLAEQLRELLASHCRRHPLEDGMSLDAVRRALGLPASEILPVLLDAPAAAGMTMSGGRVRRGALSLPESVRAAVRTLQDRLRAQPFDAPTADELAALRLDEKELAAAARAGELLRIAPKLVLLPGAEHDALRRLSQLPSPFTVSQARKALSTTRRVAVPLLEWLARRGHTQRLPDGTHQLRRPPPR
jgi:selenocysteine-specific elongation factor